MKKKIFVYVIVLASPSRPRIQRLCKKKMTDLNRLINIKAQKVEFIIFLNLIYGSIDLQISVFLNTNTPHIQTNNQSPKGFFYTFF